ncbi:hypothetical protein H4582DRAFT_2054424 [Lactarius indigo]|nr:hypothetical protein H4582DRAFT_2054424 [Lactarius indigo]
MSSKHDVWKDITKGSTSYKTGSRYIRPAPTSDPSIPGSNETRSKVPYFRRGILHIARREPHKFLMKFLGETTKDPGATARAAAILRCRYGAKARSRTQTPAFCPAFSGPLGVARPCTARTPSTQSKKCDSVGFDSATRNQSQDDYPDGGLQACAWIGFVQYRNRGIDIDEPRLCTFFIAECHEYWQLLLYQLRHWCQYPKYLSGNLIVDSPLSLAFMWSRIWTRDFKKCRATTLGSLAAFFLNRRHGVPRGVPNLARRSWLTIQLRSPTVKLTMRTIVSCRGNHELDNTVATSPTTLCGGFFNSKQFKSPAYTVYTASGIVIFLGISTRKPGSCRLSYEKDLNPD